MSQLVHPVILCGGAGSRLWPLSVPKAPKQFLALTSEKSMIEETAERFIHSYEPAVSFAEPLVIGSAEHRQLLTETLPTARQVLEPIGRNSAPAVAAACLAQAPDDLLLILAADHSIRNVPAFHRAIVTAVESASRDAIVTFGVKPTHPATEYGYIKAAGPAVQNESIAVAEFVEKPPLADAKAYMEAGNYFWNAGIFLFKASAMLEALSTHAPEVLSATRSAMSCSQSQSILLDKVAFSHAPNISIDFAVMEHAENVETIPVNMNWSDVGGFPALRKLLTDGPTANYQSGPVLLNDSSGLYVRSEGPTISVNGVSNLAIVATDKDVLITPIADAAAIKALGAEVQKKRHAMAVSPSLVHRARDWLWSTFDFWSDKAWDAEHGGFVEQLSMSGAPDRTADRRVRVQARQVFSFARALQYGWDKQSAATKMISDGIAFLDRQARHENGGWAHVVNCHGQVVNPTQDLYDHAFIILAGAAAYESIRSEKALEIAYQSVAFIDDALKAEPSGGWHENQSHDLPRRANPHMHLLEAACSLFRATKDTEALALAKKCVTLFETQFFDPQHNVVIEFFDEDWNPQSHSLEETIIETGHMYEWASLLHEYESLTQHDTLSWRRRLIRRADQNVKRHGLGLALNSERVGGGAVNAKRRLWPQLEMFRAHLLHPGLNPNGTPERIFDSIMQNYIQPSPDGLWIDELDEDGGSASNAVPASILYHFITAFAPLIE